jgi:ABC-type nitrate/sulfonate/bicarbonate transport system substrate-binding protein
MPAHPRLVPALALLLLVALACAPKPAPQAAPAPQAQAPAPAAAPTTPPALVPLRFGLNTPTAFVAPVWVAKDEGFFEKYGIDAELVLMQSSAQLAPALISGEVPIAVSAATGIVNAALAGSDLMLLGGYSNLLRFWFYARPEHATVGDLRGKQIAITRRGGAIHVATELVLQRHGLDADRDVTLIQVGSTNDSFTAMISGAVAAGMLSPPNTFLADDQGLRLLVDTADYRYPLIVQGFAASRAWVARNEDLTRRVIQAVSEGLAFTHQQKERTKAVIGRNTKVDDPLLLERTYEALVPAWERLPYAPLDAIRVELDSLAEEIPAARDARPEQFLDNRIVEDLDRAGFFQRLYR